MPRPTAQDSAPAPDSLRTRESLLSRLREWDNAAEWRVFFDTYWRLIFNFGKKAGLSEQDAQDLVQDVMVSMAKKLPAFTYDRSKGRFRNWLLLIVRSRLTDHWRKNLGKQLRTVSTEDQPEAVIENAADPEVEQLWDDEWRTHLLDGAFARLRRRVPARHFMLFEMAARQGLALTKVAASLGVGLTHAYVIRHRLNKMLREELQRTEDGEL